MPTYDFECEPCCYHTEIVQAHDAPSILKCPVCEQETLKKIFISPPSISIRGEPTTIGHLADRNTSKMSTWEREAKVQGDKLNKEISKEMKKKREQHRSIQSMTPEQQTHWIKTGEKPIQ